MTRLLLLSHVARKPVLGFPTRFDTNRTVQPQKMVSVLIYRIKKVEGLYYPCSEKKGADQLCRYPTTDLHFCFSAFAKSRFSHDAAQLKTDHFAYFSTRINRTRGYKKNFHAQLS